MKHKFIVLPAIFVILLGVVLFLSLSPVHHASAAYHFSNYQGKNPIHILKVRYQISSGNFAKSY